MRTLSSLLFFICITPFLSFSQQSVASRITEVTVFLSGAQVTRQAEVTLAKGENSIRFNGLSRHVRSNSVQVKGSQQFTILSAKHELSYLDNSSNATELEVLETAMADAVLKRDLRQGLQRVYGEEKAMILANKSIKGEDGVLLGEELQEMAEFFRSRLTEIEYKLVELKQEELEFNEEIMRLRRELDKLGGQRQQTTSFVDVVLNANQAGKVNVEFSTMVDAAAWIPAYDVRAKDVDSPLELVYNGRVIQHSEVDWKDVKLTLSTGNPAAGGVQPDLNPWFLYLQDEVTYKRERELGYELQRRQNMRQQALAQEGMMASFDSDVPSTGIVSNTLSTEFSVAARYDIPADNQYYDVEMRRIPMDASYKYYAAPKLDKDAFLLAGVTGWESQALLPGKSNIYFQGTFVGEGFIDPAVTGDTLQISLGRDKAVAIQRTQVVDLGRSAVFGGKKTTTRTYRIEVRNNKQVPISLVLQDQVPRSTDAAIEISAEELTGGTFNEETGTVEWILDLAPGASRTLDLQFSVRYPKKKVVAGL